MVLIRKGNMGQKACESLPGVGIRLYVKFYGDACRIVAMAQCLERSFAYPGQHHIGPNCRSCV